tara:strand:- start:1343 stop:1999 length:657 start_codon:yes stop_codon:yes gene_type:complete
MTFFGFLFQRFPISSDHGKIQYLDFLLPGICGMTVLLGASQSGISIIRDSQTGFLERMIITTKQLSSFVAGKIIADLFRVIFQAVIVIILGILLGAIVHLNVNTLASSIFLILFGFAYCCLSCLIACKTDSQEAMSAFIHIANMPIFFTSTALVPSKAMPAWMEKLAEWNPLTMAVTPLRQAMVIQEPWWNARNFIFLLTICIAIYSALLVSIKEKRI